MYNCQAVNLSKHSVLIRFNTTNTKIQSKVKRKILHFKSYFIKRKLCFMFIIPVFQFFDGILILLSQKTNDYIIKIIFSYVIKVKSS